MKLNREKQAKALNKAQAKRKEIKRQQVINAVETINQQGMKLTFRNIADMAGCSISYLYKWDEVKAYIHEAQERKDTTLNQLEEKKEGGAYSLKTLHEVAKNRIRELETENGKLKQKNKVLTGHVAEIHELRDENQRLLNQLKEHLNPTPNIKVVPINKSKPVKATATTDKTTDEHDLISSIKALGVKVSKKLREEIASRDPEQIKLSIEAFEQYRATNSVKSQEACLLSMIRDEAQPNTESRTESKPKAKSTKPEQTVVRGSDEPEEKRISLEELKGISSIFNGGK